MRPALAVLGLSLAVFLGSAQARTAAEPIEGTWNISGGQVLVTPTGPGSFQGVIVKPTTLSTCPHPAGELMWVLRGSGTHYEGTHLGFGPGGCSDRRQFPAVVDVSEEAGRFTLKLCVTITTADNRIDCNTFERAKPPAAGVKKTYLWGVTLRVGDKATLGSLKSRVAGGTGSLEAETIGSRTTVRKIAGSVRLTDTTKAGRRLSIVFAAVSAGFAPRAGGGGLLQVSAAVRSSGFANCAKGASARLVLLDAAGTGPDSFAFSACGTRRTYVDGRPSAANRVTVLIGEKR